MPIFGLSSYFLANLFLFSGGSMPKPIFFKFFSYFGPEARKPRSSRRAGSQVCGIWALLKKGSQETEIVIHPWKRRLPQLLAFPRGESPPHKTPTPIKAVCTNIANPSAAYRPRGPGDRKKSSSLERMKKNHSPTHERTILARNFYSRFEIFILD